MKAKQKGETKTAEIKRKGSQKKGRGRKPQSRPLSITRTAGHGGRTQKQKQKKKQNTHRKTVTRKWKTEGKAKGRRIANEMKIRIKLQFTSNPFAPICTSTHTDAHYSIKFIHTHNEIRSLPLSLFSRTLLAKNAEG